MRFNFVAEGDKFSFRYLLASNEYGQYQCVYSDALAFILTDITSEKTIPSKNLAVVPGTSTVTLAYDGKPVSVTNIRNTMYNSNCPNSNQTYFGQYNVAPIGDPSKSAINMREQTVVFDCLSRYYSFSSI